MIQQYTIYICKKNPNKPSSTATFHIYQWWYFIFISGGISELNVQTEYCEIATIVLFTAINLKFKSVNNTKKNKTKTVIMLSFILFNT